MQTKKKKTRNVQRNMKTINKRNFAEQAKIMKRNKNNFLK